MALDLNNIVVLSYNTNIFCISTPHEEYTFFPSDGLQASTNVMSLNDLRYINTNTKAIKHGWITFEDKDKEEIYNELRIHDWENILSNNDIKDILLNPTEDGLQKIINIDNNAYFERIRFVMLDLIETGHDITTKVKDIVDTRYSELSRKKLKSSIVLNNVQKEDKTSQLEQQNAALQSQLDELKNMMAQMMALQNVNTNTVEAPKEEAPKKPVGRPSVKKK